MVTYITDELKTFNIKIEKKCLEKVDRTHFIDFSELEFADITFKIKQSLTKLTPPKSLTFMFDSIEDIPDTIMNALTLDK